MRALPLAAAALLLAASAAPAQVSVTDPTARSSNPRVAAVHLTLTNAGESDDRLIGVRSDAARRAELHTHLMQDGIARMRPIAGGLALPAGATVTLAPGGDHVMLMGLSAPLAEGDAVRLVLELESGAEIEVEAPVVPLRAPMGNMDHGSMDHGSGGHGSMTPRKVDDGTMNHGTMDRGTMDHGAAAD